MSGVLIPITSRTTANAYFRQVLFTGAHMQIVVMALRPSEDIGMETHDVDQFFYIETGEVTAITDGSEQRLTPGSALIVTAGTEHNIINRSTSSPAKLFTVYAPPQHAEGTVHATKVDAIKDEG